MLRGGRGARSARTQGSANPTGLGARAVTPSVSRLTLTPRGARASKQHHQLQPPQHSRTISPHTEPHTHDARAPDLSTLPPVAPLLLPAPAPPAPGPRASVLPLSAAAQMDSVKDAADKAASAVDERLASLTSVAASGASAALARGCELWDTAKAHSQASLGHVEQLQDQAFDALKEGVEYCLQHPQYSYPAAAVFVLTALPGVRRLTYRLTLGRLRNPEAIVSSSEAKLATLTTRAEEFAAESKKLQERAALAAEEMTRGYGKLKAARQELQRLEGSVAKSERLASNVLQDLRSMRQNTRATELRSEVALKLSQLKQQRAAVHKEIKWIVKRDV